MAGEVGVYKPKTAITHDEKLREEAEQAATYDAAMAAAQARQDAYQASYGPPPPPPAPVVGPGVIGQPTPGPGLGERIVNSPYLNPAHLVTKAAHNEFLNPAGYDIPDTVGTRDVAHKPGEAGASIKNEFGEPVDTFKPGTVAPTPTPDEGGDTGTRVTRPGVTASGPGYPAGGGAAQIIPGGMMPFTEKTETKIARGNAPGEREMSAAAMRLGLDSAEIRREANQRLFSQEEQAAQLKLAASDSAATKHAALQQEQDAAVRDRLSQIESLNKQASTKSENLWTDGGLGRLLGFLFTTLGAVGIATGGGSKSSIGLGLGSMASGGYINGLIDNDINTKMQERKMAGEQAKRQTDLLGLHLDNFKSRGAAIDATKLAYYDTVLNEMEIYRAKHRGEVNEGNFRDLQANLLDDRRKIEHGLYLNGIDEQQTEDVSKMRPPQVVGGGGGAGTAQARPEHLVVLPDGSTATFPKEVIGDAIKTIDGYTNLIRMNEDILEKRQEIRELGASYIDIVADPKKYAHMRALQRQIDDTVESKIKIMSKSEDRSVVHEAEKEAAILKQSGGVRGLGMTANETINPFGAAYEKGHDEMIQNQIKRANAAAYGFVRAGGGSLVNRGFGVNAQGHLIQTGEFTGQDLTPPEGMAPRGFRPMNPEQEVATAGAPLRETTPYSPFQGKVPPAPPASHKKKK